MTGLAHVQRAEPKLGWNGYVVVVDAALTFVAFDVAV